MDDRAIDRLMEEIFCQGRDRRSHAYKSGCRAYLERKLVGTSMECPYLAGTAEFDAFWAGCDEASLYISKLLDSQLAG